MDSKELNEKLDVLLEETIPRKSTVWKTHEIYGAKLKKLVDKYSKHIAYGVPDGDIEYHPQYDDGVFTVHHAVRMGRNYPEDKKVAFEKEYSRLKHPKHIYVHYSAGYEKNKDVPHTLRSHVTVGGDDFSKSGRVPKLMGFRVGTPLKDPPKEIPSEGRRGLYLNWSGRMGLPSSR